MRSDQRPTAARLVLISILLAGAFLLAGAQRADARPYYVAECLPENPTATDAFWQRSESPSNFGVYSNCGNPTDGLSLTYGGISQEGDWASWGFNAPPGTNFAGITASYFINTQNGVGGFWWPTPHAAQTFQTVGQGSYISWPTPGTNGIHFFMRCYRPTCERTTVPVLHLHHLFFTVEDPAPPTLETGGSLLTDGVKHGAESLELNSTDPAGGGVKNWRIVVNGQLAEEWQQCALDEVPGRPGWVRSFHPCPSQGAVTRSVDTSLPPFANGPNDVRVCAYDVAANESNCVSRTIQVDNSCPSSGGTTPAARISGGVEDGPKVVSSVRVRSTAEPVVRGAVTAASGQPVEGATVCIFERTALPDAAPELAAQTTTQPNGRFATQLEAGPSRSLSIVYRSNNVVLTESASVRSTVVPTLTAPSTPLSNGQNARFAGVLPGPDADSRAVTLQARAGRKWRTFKQLRTDGEGRFKGIYRFTQTVGRTRYVFRVLVKRQRGYPYEAGTSRRLRILVRG